MENFPFLNQKLFTENNLNEIKKFLFLISSEKKAIEEYLNLKKEYEEKNIKDLQIFDSNDYELNQLFLENYDNGGYIESISINSSLYDFEYGLEELINNFQAYLNTLIINLDTYLNTLKQKITDEYSSRYKLHLLNICINFNKNEYLNDIELCKSTIKPYQIIFDKLKTFYNKISVLHDNILNEYDIYKKAHFISGYSDKKDIELFNFMKDWEDNIFLNSEQLELDYILLEKEEIKINTGKVENILKGLGVKKV